jgi:hypothetical protein
LVADEAVGGQQLEGVDLKEHPVEEEVVGRGTQLRLLPHTRLGELLQGSKVKLGQINQKRTSEEHLNPEASLGSGTN